jgi:hypothetical protein
MIGRKGMRSAIIFFSLFAPHFSSILICSHPTSPLLFQTEKEAKKEQGFTPDKLY